jgi:hypothetical protein
MDIKARAAAAGMCACADCTCTLAGMGMLVPALLPCKRPQKGAHLYHPQHEEHVWRELLDAHFLDGGVGVERVHPARVTQRAGGRVGAVPAGR